MFSHLYDPESPCDVTDAPYIVPGYPTARAFSGLGAALAHARRVARRTGETVSVLARDGEGWEVTP